MEWNKAAPRVDHQSTDYYFLGNAHRTMNAFVGERRGRYACARDISKNNSSSSSSTAAGPLLDRALSDDEFKQLCKPIADVFHRNSCYNAMGQSTQVVVVEVHSPLTVAFIAAQETKAPQCVLWDSVSRTFAGVLPTTEYIKILLYCHAHPEEREAVTRMTVLEWLRKTEEQSNRPAVVVASAADDSLYSCFEKMIKFGVRKSLLVVGKEGNDMSLVGVMSFEHLLKFLTTELFSLDADNAVSTLGTDAADVAGNSGILPQRVMNIVLGVSPSTDRPVDDSDGSSLPIGVGPYRDILDVPFSQIPLLGAHRRDVIKVQMKTPVEQALRILVEQKVHSVAVVDDYDIIIDVVSRNDVMRMETNGMYDVTMTVAEAISFHVGGKIFVFHETDTVRDILLLFAQSKVRQLYLVDPNTDKLTGQLSMSEFLRFLFQGAVPPNAKEF